MAADQQVAAWFLATIAPFCLNALLRQRPDAVGVSAMLIVGWGFQRMCWAMWSPPQAMQLYPLMDLAFGLTVLGAWATERRAWKLVLVGVFVTQCALHASFWLRPDAKSILPYLGLNNMLYAVELCVAASPGVGHALAVLAGNLLPPPPRLRPHAGP